MKQKYLLIVIFITFFLGGCALNNKYDTLTVPNDRPKGYIKFYCDSWMPNPLLIKRFGENYPLNRVGRIMTGRSFYENNFTIEREPGIYKFSALIDEYPDFLSPKENPWSTDFEVNVVADTTTGVKFIFLPTDSKFDWGTTRTFYTGRIKIESPIPVGK